jgi:hypothetical protein
MNKQPVILVLLFIGMVILVSGTALMLLALIMVSVCRGGQWERRVDNLLSISTRMVDIGLLIFLWSLACFGIFIVIEALRSGVYRLRFGKIGGDTIILWKDRPIRFAFQTAMFIGFAIFSIYFSIKKR